jgi:hypothetical protein
MATQLLEREPAEHVTSRRAEHTAFRYLLAFLFIGVVIYLLPLLAERIPALQPYSASEWGFTLDHGYDLHHTNADIVIFGDSSALYGVDTPRLSTQLGMKAINLPQSIGSLVVSGDLSLRKYLAVNRPPRMIVFYLAPWNRDFGSASDEYSYEGTEQVLRHATNAELLHLLRNKPDQLILFPLRFYLVHSALTSLWVVDGPHLPVHDGFVSLPASVMGPMHGRCTIAPQLLRVTSDRSLQQMLSTFSRAGTQLVTVLAPVPRCDGVDQLSARFGAALTVLPPQYFSNDGLLVHTLAGYTDQTTDRVATILQAGLAQH